MTNRERFEAIMHYKNYDRMPCVHFGFWEETYQKWFNEGKISMDESKSEELLANKCGFDFGYVSSVSGNTSLLPQFDQKVLEITPQGFKKILSVDGVIELVKDGVTSIPSEIGHTLSDRDSFEEFYRDKLTFKPERIPVFTEKDLLYMKSAKNPFGIHVGSLFGRIRDILGVEGTAYLYADDEELYTEIIDIVGDTTYRVLEGILHQCNTFSCAHFWEDICFKNGPLVIPHVFREKVGPHYKKITSLLNKNGIDIVSLDCDGCIDSLIPIWLENGVNTMFPIEYGTWRASIAPWREKYGKELRGIGGMNKNIFSRDYNAVDEEISRLQNLCELGGYIPCPDHRIAPDAIFENVQYFCNKFKRVFS